jgi:hypothetical protein
MTKLPPTHPNQHPCQKVPLLSCLPTSMTRSSPLSRPGRLPPSCTITKGHDSPGNVDTRLSLSSQRTHLPISSHNTVDRQQQLHDPKPSIRLPWQTCPSPSSSFRTALVLHYQPRGLTRSCLFRMLLSQAGPPPSKCYPPTHSLHPALPPSHISLLHFPTSAPGLLANTILPCGCTFRPVGYRRHSTPLSQNLHTPTTTTTRRHNLKFGGVHGSAVHVHTGRCFGGDHRIGYPKSDISLAFREVTFLLVSVRMSFLYDDPGGLSVA